MYKYLFVMWFYAVSALGDGVWSAYLAEEKRATPREAIGVAKETCSLCVLDQPKLAALIATDEPFELDVPLPDGSFKPFTVQRSALMHPDLAAKFPEIQVCEGWSADGDTLRFDLSPQGLRAQILQAENTFYIDPYFKGETTVHAAFDRKDYRRDFVWECRSPLNDPRLQFRRQAVNLSNGDTLRTYRLAVAATAEYTGFYGGTVAGAMAGIVTTINRVTGIYERELAISFQLVANNDQVVFTDTATDGYSNSNDIALLNQNQIKMDAVIGTANYDIGHVFSTDGGGLALGGVVCVDGDKARGETGSSFPQGDSFDVDFVAHEMGHQFGANHSFNGSGGSCSNNRNASTAYEPGSGSTILSYAGICSVDNLQPLSDDYFHSASFEQIINYVTVDDGANCAVSTATGNTAPLVDAGVNYIIPAQTPFLLIATGSDPDGDPVSYTWEQRDLGPVQSVFAADNGMSPLLRSWPPTLDPTRTVPRLSDLLAGSTVAGERLPTLGRTMNFRVTARDNRPGGGGVNSDDMAIIIDGGSGPFSITQPNTMVFWSGAETIQWDPAGTLAPPVNAATVNILLSMDGGTNFPVVLAANTPNDGSESVVLPNVRASSARIKIEAVGNVFFDISNVDFSINPFDLLEVSPQIDRFVIAPSGFVSAQPCLTYRAENKGVGSIEFVAGSSENWLSALPDSGTLPGMVSTNISFCFTTSADALPPGDHTAQIYVANDLTGVTNRWNVLLTVEPSGGTIQFVEAQSVAFEDEGAVPVWISRTGDIRSPATVMISAVDDSAVSGADFSLSTNSVSWAANDGSNKMFAVNLEDDALTEVNESMTLQLANPSSQAILGVQSNASFVIRDNDIVVNNDVCGNAFEITTIPFANTQSTSLFGNDGDPIPGCSVNGANGGWYRITPAVTGTLEIDTVGSSFNTVLGIYVGECGGLTEIYCDDNGGTGSTAKLDVPVFVGVPYFIFAGGFNGAVGSLSIRVNMSPSTNPCYELVKDGGFELASPNTSWTVQTSTQFPSVICDTGCGADPLYASPHASTKWGWFSTANSIAENASLGQSLLIPAGTATLRFQLWIGTVAAPFTDTFNVRIDGVSVAAFPEPATSDVGYMLREFDVSTYADNGVHELIFEYAAPGAGDSNYNLDDVSLEVCITDLDGDGLPNDWESSNGLNPTNALDAVRDSDSDRMNNLDEYAAGTNPQNGADFLQLRIETPPLLELSFDSVSGKTYAIDFAADLLTPSWNNLVTNLPGDGAKVSVVDTNRVEQRMYRLNVLRP